MKPQDAGTLSPSAKEALRKRTVEAVKRGVKQKKAAEMFGVSVKAVNNWVKTYREYGDKGLDAQKQGRPKGGSLKPWQAAQIAWTIKDKQPDQLNLPFHLWTRESVAVLIEARFGIHYSIVHVGRLLKRWGYTPQKPLRRAYEKDPVAVQKWLDKTYPEIRKQAQKEDALLYWGDEMGIRSDHATGRTYGKRGQTPVVPGSGRRFSCNMISTITNRGHLMFMVFDQSFNTSVFLDFLRRMIKQNERKVFLILDNHKVHHAKKVARWVEKHQKEIRLFFLPSYSPELNPDERLNCDVKLNAVGRKRAKNATEMKDNVRSYLKKRQCQPDVVQNYFLDRSVRYAA